jgi:hypothetical protein
VFKFLNLDDEHGLELEADLLGALDFKIPKDLKNARVSFLRTGR